MDKQKLLNAIGMAYGSTNVIYGAKLLDFIKANKVSFVIIGSNMGPSQKKKLIDKCKSHEIEYHDDILTIEEIAQACGRTTIVAVGFNNFNFIKLIKSNLDQ
ncbi:L7Ae/L30e/S12e/Gadd45 family ribosomal protein [[Acholeplasma] multilocale]|uniref:L7Ae/L30e/S12e/Gadd45 family ribosomal protein n=1 Tax=[Acholeplasma] multilocale TaxID=264638 RepID=UPI000406C3B4|nr:ribosomal L7Ae/L30e/S12e/Gadd45 family protein [[Acholeplasma] multilocale]